MSETLRPPVRLNPGIPHIGQSRDFLINSPPVFGKEPILLGNIIPMPWERGQVNEGIAKTAAHELNHAILGLKLGATPILLSVVPGDGYLGYTAFAGVDLKTLRIIAAGGAVSTAFGQAKGYGGDLSIIDQINRVTKDGTIDSSINTARSILSGSGYSKEVIKRASEIIAFRQSVPGWMIAPILERAKLELEWEESKNSATFAALKNQTFNFDKEAYDKSLENLNAWIVRPIGGGPDIAIYVDENKKRHEFEICPVCGHLNNRESECAHKAAGYKQTGEVGFNPNKKSGTIFDSLRKRFSTNIRDFIKDEHP